MRIEKEAIRVAAAAAALVEDCQRPASPRGRTAEGLAAPKWWDAGEMVLGMVRDERARRVEKYGDRPRSPMEWLMVLAAEVGELADAVTASTPPGRRGGRAVAGGAAGPPSFGSLTFNAETRCRATGFDGGRYWD
jgi:hypothetical protein